MASMKLLVRIEAIWRKSRQHLLTQVYRFARLTLLASIAFGLLVGHVG